MASPESIYEEIVSKIPACNKHKLREKLDFENGNVEVHLVEIANSMYDWEANLATLLGLSRPDIHDIVFSNQNRPVLQQ